MGRADGADNVLISALAATGCRALVVTPAE
jgi:hypothetical protein